MRSNEFIILAVQVISDEIDASFLQLNKNVTTDFRWLYAYCTANCYVTIRNSNTTFEKLRVYFGSQTEFSQPYSN